MGFDDHRPIEAMLHIRITSHTQARLSRAEESTNLHESISFPWNEPRLLAGRDVFRKGRLSGVLQIVHGKDRAFLPEKQIPCLFHVNRV